MLDLRTKLQINFILGRNRGRAVLPVYLWTRPAGPGCPSVLFLGQKNSLGSSFKEKLQLNSILGRNRGRTVLPVDLWTRPTGPGCPSVLCLVQVLSSQH